MIALTSELTFSPAILLWLIFSLAAALLLVSALNRRRSSLTNALKAFVARHNKSGEAAANSAARKAESQKLAEKIKTTDPNA